MTTCPPDCAVVTLGDRDFIMAPLNFDQLEALAPRFDQVINPDPSLGWQMVSVSANALAEIVLASLSKHQPDLALKEVKQLLTRKNSAALFAKVLQVSGMQSEGEAAAGSRSAA